MVTTDHLRCGPTDAIDPKRTARFGVELVIQLLEFVLPCGCFVLCFRSRTGQESVSFPSQELVKLSSE